jgi:hypothetical protein
MGQRLDRFRAVAAECVEAAGKSTDVNAAATLLSMAQRWLELAGSWADPNSRRWKANSIESRCLAPTRSKVGEHNADRACCGCT